MIKSKEIATIHSDTGRLVMFSEQDARRICNRLGVGFDAMVEEHDGVVVNFGGKATFGVDVVDTVYEGGIVCPTVMVGLIPDEFVRFLNEDEQSFTEYSTSHPAYVAGMEVGSDTHRRVLHDYKNYVQGIEVRSPKLNRKNPDLDAFFGIVEEHTYETA
jgi:hypothetical protein